MKTWEEARIAKSSVASTCGHDPAFSRVGPGVFALRAITPLPQVHPPLRVCLILLHPYPGRSCVARQEAQLSSCKCLPRVCILRKQLQPAGQPSVATPAEQSGYASAEQGSTALQVAPARNATLGQKAAAAIAAVQAKEAEVLQRLAEDGGADGAGHPAANTLKCPRCHKVRSRQSAQQREARARELNFDSQTLSRGTDFRKLS